MGCVRGGGGGGENLGYGVTSRERDVGSVVHVPSPLKKKREKYLTPSHPHI